MENYYEILELSPNASIEIIKVAYKRLSLKYHPDNQHTGNIEKMKKINEAHEVLSDSEKRKEFNLKWKKEQEQKHAEKETTEKSPQVLTKAKPDKLTGEHIIITYGYMEIDRGVFSVCNDIKNIKIPNSVAIICDSAFLKCNIKNIEIPDSVTIIGEHAFNQSGLTRIKLSNSLTNISKYMFMSCANLTNIKIPDSVTTIDTGAFEHCKNLLSINIPDGVTIIGESAFYRCMSLTYIYIPDSVRIIGSKAFYKCDKLTVRCSKKSEAYKYCRKNKIKVKKI